jgi:hypothetical protein
MPPSIGWLRFKWRASSAHHRPFSVCTLAEITTWVCNWGSSGRDVV